MPDVPDLDALREKAEKATPGPWLQDDLDGCRLIADDAAREDSTADVAEFWIIEDAEYIAAVSPDVLLAVLSLVDDLRAENERLREASAGWQEALIALGACSSPTSQTERERYEKADVVRRYLLGIRRALAGSPAANEEQQ